MESKGPMSQVFDLSLKELLKALRTPTTFRDRVSQCGLEELVSALIPGSSVQEVESLRQELLEDHEFYSWLNEAYLPIRHRRLGGGPHEGGVQREALYSIIRLLKPRNFVETGVFDGLSSSFILRAMDRNGVGHLSSIDLPAVKFVRHTTTKKMGVIPEGRQPGWLIPEPLRERHTLLLGDARQLLGGRLQELEEIDGFFHDSMHTYEHMYWEFETIWPFLRRDGLLLSDDIFGLAARGVFFKFCRHKKIEGHSFDKLGAARKTSP